MGRYFRNTNFLIGSIILSLMLILLIVSFFHTPYDVTAMDLAHKLEKPSAEHLLGTDQFGRDIMSRMMKGIEVSILIGFTAVLSGFVFGLLIGSFSGYFGGRLDEIVMKLIDTLMAFPGVLLAMMLIAVFGNGLLNTIIALSVMAVPRFARIARSGYMELRDSDFVKAERIRGAGCLRIMYLHILPNIMSELIATASLSFASAIMSESGLSYLGLGMQPPSPSLGIMLSEAQDYMLRAPWYVLIPTVTIALLVIAFNLIGDGLQEMNRGGR